MTKEHNLKNLLRAQWKKKRDAISVERKYSAADKLIIQLLPLIQNARNVLSYVSLENELDTKKLNIELAKSGRLVLPKVVGSELHLFKVHDLENELTKGAFSIMEPDANLCKATPVFLVDIALVPAIAFDAANHRLGFGKGFYDRFLGEHGKQFTTIGIGFEEQLSPTVLPVEKHDIALSRILLV